MAVEVSFYNKVKLDGKTVFQLMDNVGRIFSDIPTPSPELAKAMYMWSNEEEKQSGGWCIPLTTNNYDATPSIYIGIISAKYKPDTLYYKMISTLNIASHKNQHALAFVVDGNDIIVTYYRMGIESLDVTGEYATSSEILYKETFPSTWYDAITRSGCTIESEQNFATMFSQISMLDTIDSDIQDVLKLLLSESTVPKLLDNENGYYLYNPEKGYSENCKILAHLEGFVD